MKYGLMEIIGERNALSDTQNDKFSFPNDVITMPEDTFRKFFKGTNEKYAEFLNEFGLNTHAIYKSKQDLLHLPIYVKKFIDAAYDKKYISFFDIRLNQIDRGAITKHKNGFEQFTLSLNELSDDKFNAIAKDFQTTYSTNNPALASFCYIDSEAKTINLLSSALVLYVDESNDTQLYTSYESRDKANIRVTPSIEFPNSQVKEIFQNYLTSQNKDALYDDLSSFGINDVTINNLKIEAGKSDEKKFLIELKKSLDIRVELKKSTNMNLTAAMQHLFKTADKYLDEDELLVVKAANGQNYTKSDYLYNTEKSPLEMEFVNVDRTAKSMQRETALENRGSMSPNTSKEYIDDNGIIDNDNRNETEEIVSVIDATIAKEAASAVTVDNTISETLTALQTSNATRYDAFVKMQMEQIAIADELAKKAFEKFKANVLVSGNLIDNFNKINAELLRGNTIAYERFDFLVKQDLINTALKDKIINEFQTVVVGRNTQIDSLNNTIKELDSKISELGKKNSSIVAVYDDKLKAKEQEIIDVEIVFDEYKIAVSTQIDELTDKLKESDSLIADQQSLIKFSKKELERIPLLEQTNSDLKESLSTKDGFINDLKESVSAKEKLIEDLKNENKKLETDFETVKRENHNLKSKNELLTSNNAQLIAELERVNKLVEDLKNKNAEANKEIHTLKELFKTKQELVKQEESLVKKDSIKEKIVQHTEYVGQVSKDELLTAYNKEMSIDSNSKSMMRVYLIKNGTIDTSKISLDEEKLNDLQELYGIGLIDKKASGAYIVKDEYARLLFTNYDADIVKLAGEKDFFDHINHSVDESKQKFIYDYNTASVKINRKVDKDEFNKLRVDAKKEGGIYQSNVGFVFKNPEAAQTFFDRHRDADFMDADIETSKPTSQNETASKIKRNR